jgi:organic hydroperoxide reductase OsmC/OhrA
MTTIDSLETTEPVAPRVRRKSFTYRTSTGWTSGRSGVLEASGRPALAVSSPPEFKGEAGRWTPEDLFVAAIDLCTMTTFLSFAQRLSLPLLGYRSEAEGLLEFVDDGYRFTKVVLRPTLVLADPAAVAPAAQAMHDAHQACLIGRSVRAEVVVEPRFEVAKPQEA